MFGKLREKLKSALGVFSKKAVEEAEIAEEKEVIEEKQAEEILKEPAEELIEKKEVKKKPKTKKVVEETNNKWEDLRDIVDENDNVIETVTKKEMREKNLLHRRAAALIFNSKGKIFVHKRVKTKDIYGGYFDTTVGGGVDSGEDYETAVKREIKEEIGADIKNLKFLFDYRFKNEINCYISKIYTAIYDGQITLEKDEIESGEFITIEELKKLMKKEKFCPDAIEIFQKYEEKYPSAERLIIDSDEQEQEEKIEGVKITYFVHGTTTDNEHNLATGWNPGELSPTGELQARELGKAVADEKFAVIFTSDLKRAVDSTNLGFKNRYRIIQDLRLRECNYGQWNSKKKNWDIADYILNRYPSGESYSDVEKRMTEFLNDLYKNYQGKRIAIVGHQAPQLALDVLLKHKTWEEAINEDWRKKKAWQLGWKYQVKEPLTIKEIPKVEVVEKSKGGLFGLFKKKVVKEEPKIITKTEKPELRTEYPTLKTEEIIEEKKSFFGKLKQSITTKTISTEKFEELFWDLELVLLENNVSVEVIEKIKEDLKVELVDKPLPRDVSTKIEETLKRTLDEILTFDKIDLIENSNQKKPLIIALFGINGSGKTTSIAKLTKYFQNHNKTVVLAACDTFRAAAIQQLEEHANRLGVKIIKHDYGSDAAAVAYDAIKYAEKNKIDVVLIDTAGRLHSNTNLMQELDKIIRVTKPDFKIFIGESITGNDCIEQAKRFNELTEMDGTILTKADVDEKGGAPLSIAYTIKKPILFLGMGQKYEDLEEFNKEKILESLGF